MNLNQLYYFRKLAELEHYTNAAKELYITQPTLSDSMSALEEELGVPLFQRIGRNIRLTKHGHNFYHHVCNALRELEIGIENAKKHSTGVGGTLDIACIPTLCSYFLPNAIHEYKNNINPSSNFNVFSATSSYIVDGIKSKLYDIGFCSKVDNEPDLIFVPILAQKIILVVNKDHPLASTSYIELEELVKNYTTITYRDSLPIGKTIYNLLKGNVANTSFAYEDEISICGFISQNNSVAIVANTPFLKQFDNLHYIRTNAPCDARLIYMVYHKKNFACQISESFANYIIANKMDLPS